MQMQKQEKNVIPLLRELVCFSAPNSRAQPQETTTVL
jgi:hypothetical protein